MAFTDGDLTRMAHFPGDALHQWVRLTDSQRGIIVDRMKHFYGHRFAADFQKSTANKPRPDGDAQIINASDITPDQLESAGYKYGGDTGGIRKWVHPSGKEVWIIFPAKGTTPAPPKQPGPVPPVKPPKHPDVEDAQRDAKNLTELHDSLWKRASDSFNPDGTPRKDFDQTKYENDRSDYDDKLDEALSNAKAARAEGPFTDEEAKEMDEAINRYEQLKSEEAPSYSNPRGS